MRNKYTLITLIALLVATFAHAQVKRAKLPPVVCPVNPNHSAHHVPPPQSFLKNHNHRVASARTTKNAEIIVEYNGFSPEAEEAFQYAVDIWASLLYSDVPIYVQANYEVLDDGVLGSAGATEYLSDFPGAPKPELYYPIALVEKLTGREWNAPGNPDIVARFSSVFDWYLGTDGNPSGRQDFVTVVLHELCHGLGFSGLVGSSSWEFTEDSGEGSRYGSFIVDGTGLRMFDVENGSTELEQYLTSDNLFLDNPASVKANGNTLPKIYAPDPWNGGSSISHWDDATFDGTDNALMTHALSSGEAVHDPGATTLGLFRDLGWFTSGIYHEPLIVADNSRELTIDAEIFSDTTITSSDISLTYTFNGTDFFISTMDEYETNNFRSTLTLEESDGTSFAYFISGLSDGYGDDFISPAQGVYQVDIFSFDSFDGDYSNDLETSAADFAIQNISGSEWVLGSSSIPGKEGTASGSNAFVLAPNDGNYEPRTEAYIYTPVFDFSLSGVYTISFAANYNTEAEWDGFTLQYATANTNEWRFVPGPISASWYDEETIFNSEAFTFPEATPMFSGTTNNSFVTKTLEIDDLSGNDELQFRFVFKSDGLEDLVGAAIDDFSVTVPTDENVTADFSVVAESPCLGGFITVDNASSGLIAGYSWDFGEGANPATATGYGPFNVTYSSGGTKTITMNALDGGGGVLGTDTEEFEVLTFPVNQSLAETNAQYCGDDIVEITLESSESGITYQLQRLQNLLTDFGDPITGTGEAITFSLEGLQADDYHFFVTASNQAACDLLLSTDVQFEVLPVPVVEIEVDRDRILSVEREFLDSYQWFLDGVAIDGATNFNYVAEASGSYSLAVTEDGCAFTTEAVAIEILSFDDTNIMSIYPNPATDFVDIQFETEGKAKIVVRDLAGRTLIRSKESGSHLSLDLRSLEAGIYFLEITQNQKLTTSRLIKQ